MHVRLLSGYPQGQDRRCLRPKGDAVRIAVRDTGIGIPAGQIAAIFDPFVRIDTRFVREREGTGLGLSISRDLARGMGGDLSVESVEGEGSTFTVTLRRGSAK